MISERMSLVVTTKFFEIEVLVGGGFNGELPVCNNTSLEYLEDYSRFIGEVIEAKKQMILKGNKNKTDNFWTPGG